MARSLSSPARLVPVGDPRTSSAVDRPAVRNATPAPCRWWHPIGRSAIGAVREVTATAAAVWGAPSSRRHHAAPLDAGGRRPSPTAFGDPIGRSAPVVLVHGFAGSPASWFAVRRALRGEGRTVVSFDYPPWAPSLEELADRLVETVEDVRAATGADKVHLVGHSLGGVIIALALTRQAIAGHVDLVVTLGSPFSGSPWAGLLPLGPLVGALRPGSPVLQRLATAPAPAGVRWLAFAAALDAIVPAQRAVPANRRATRVVIDASGHVGMLVHPEVIARIVAETTFREDAEDLGRGAA